MSRPFADEMSRRLSGEGATSHLLADKLRAFTSSEAASLDNMRPRLKSQLVCARADASFGAETRGAASFEAASFAARRTRPR